MAFDLGDIFTTVKAKSEGVKEAIGGVRNLEEQAKGGAKRMNDFAGGFQTFAKQSGAVLMAVGVGLTAFAKNANDFTVEYVNSSRRLAREIGTTITEASRLTYAFTRMNLTADQVSTAFGVFSKQISAATKDGAKNRAELLNIQAAMKKTQYEIDATTKEIAKNGDKSGELRIKLQGLTAEMESLKVKATQTGTAFDRLGISTVDATGKQKDFKTLLFEVADKFKTMPDGVDKTALSMELFGRSGKDMIPLLNKGSAGIEELEKAADKLGITLTSKTINAVARLNESNKKLKENMDAIKIAVGTLTAPVLASFNEKLAAMLGKFQELDGPMKDIVANVLAFGGPVASGSGAVLEWVGNLGAAKDTMKGFNLASLSGIPIIGNLAGALSKLGGFLSNPYVLAIIAVIAVTGLLLQKFGLLKPMIDFTVQALQGIWNAFMVMLKPAIDSINKSLTELKPVIDILLQGLKWIAIIIGGTIVAAIVAFAMTLAAVAAVIAYQIAAWAKIFVWLKDIVVGVFNGIKGYIDAKLNEIAVALAFSIAVWQGIWNRIAALPGQIGAWFGRIPGIISGGMSAAAGVISGWVGNFLNSGRALIDAFANGIQQRIGRIKDIVSGGLAAVRRLLPFSDAKEGPLSDLTLSGKRLMTTIGGGAKQGAPSLYKAVSGVFDGLPAATLSADSRIGTTASANELIPGLGTQMQPTASGNSKTDITNNHYYGDIVVDDEKVAEKIFGKLGRNQEYAAKGMPTQAGSVGA